MEKRTDPHGWWNGLEPQWRKAFIQAFFNDPTSDFEPTDSDLAELLNAEVLRCAGPTAPYPNLSVALTNLSGVAALRKLKFLSVTDCAIEGLQELRAHTGLTSLFVNSNQITSLVGIENNHGLEKLYAQNNRITSLEPLRDLLQLDTLYLAENALTTVSGLRPEHGDRLRDFYLLPQDKLPNRELIKLQMNLGILAKRG